jgi:hypothetical protein
VWHFGLLDQDVVIGLVDENVVRIQSGDLRVYVLVWGGQIDASLVAVVEALGLIRYLELGLHVWCLDIYLFGISLVFSSETGPNFRAALRNDVEPLLKILLLHERDHLFEVLIATRRPVMRLFVEEK